MQRIPPSKDWRAERFFDYVDDLETSASAGQVPKSDAWEQAELLAVQLNLDGIPSRFKDSNSGRLIVEVPSNIAEMRAQFRAVLTSSGFRGWRYVDGKEEILQFVWNGIRPDQLVYLVSPEACCQTYVTLCEAVARSRAFSSDKPARPHDVQVMPSHRFTGAFDLCVRRAVNLLPAIHDSPLHLATCDRTTYGKTIDFVALTEHVTRYAQ